MRRVDVCKVALAILAEAGVEGRTSNELRDQTGVTHGSASAVLSRMHKAGQCVRLVEKRNRQSVYVLPEFTEGRGTLVHGAVTVTEAATEGFQQGYDLGLAAGRLESQEWSYRRGYDTGWDAAVDRMAQRMDQCLDEMVHAIRQVHGIAPFPRDGRSWMTQPQHTIEAMRRFVRTNRTATLARRAEVVDLTERRAMG